MPRTEIALPYGLNVRLTVDQRLFVQMVAEANDEPISAALRRIIDEAIALVVEDGKLPDGTRTDVFGIIERWEPDPAWAIRHGDEDASE